MRLESLLLITHPDHEALQSPGVDEARMPPHLSSLQENVEEDRWEDLHVQYRLLTYLHRSRGNRAKHLGRVAAEYMQLLYHASKARAEQCIFVDEIQWVCELYYVVAFIAFAQICFAQ